MPTQWQQPACHQSPFNSAYKVCARISLMLRINLVARFVRHLEINLFKLIFLCIRQDIFPAARTNNFDRLRSFLLMCHAPFPDLIDLEIIMNLNWALIDLIAVPHEPNCLPAHCNVVTRLCDFSVLTLPQSVGGNYVRFIRIVISF